MHWDYLLVGAGLFNAVLCERMTRAGRRCLVIDRRAHVGGNVYTETVEGMVVHRYGAHIFHTDHEAVWRYVNDFASFHPYIHKVLAVWQGQTYSLPFNMRTFVRLWGDNLTPEQARGIIERQILASGVREPRNLEEQAILLVGTDVYERLVKGYTQKQWGRPCKELPPFIIRRLPVRYTADDRYFTDRYQGVPEGGYTPMIERMLSGAKVLLGTEYAPFIAQTGDTFGHTVFTGEVDRLFDERLGRLAFRSLRFEDQLLDQAWFQPTAVVNYTGAETPYTRIIEHKRFLHQTGPRTLVTYEYPQPYAPGENACYPINDDENNALYARYRAMANAKGLLLGGRLGEYRYMNMDETVMSALGMAERVLAREDK